MNGNSQCGVRRVYGATVQTSSTPLLKLSHSGCGNVHFLQSDTVTYEQQPFQQTLGLLQPLSRSPAAPLVVTHPLEPLYAAGVRVFLLMLFYLWIFPYFVNIDYELCGFIKWSSELYC